MQAKRANRNTVKTFFLKVILFVPLLIFVMMVNYIADPAGLFGKAENEARLAEMLIEKRDVCIIANYNERLLQKLYIESLKVSPEIVVVGSSRSMQISQDVFPGHTLFNNSVSNAVIQDYLAITQIYQDNGLKPSTVVLGIDPWVLNKNNNISRWRELGKEYEKALRRISSDEGIKLPMQFSIDQKYLMLMSPSYFQRSLRTLLNKSDKKEIFYEPESLNTDEQIKLADGSLLMSRADRNKTEEEVKVDALGYVSDYRLSKFKKPDQATLKILEEFIVSLRYENIDVIFFLPPYHPITYKMMMESSNYRVIADVEKALRDLAEKKNVLILGSYDPSNCSLNGSDFYDRYHPRREAIKKIINYSGNQANTD
jgi:hypothetical protein